MRATVIAAAAILAVTGTAHAEMVSKSGRFGGVQVDYRVVLPPGYQADKAYPTILVFTGGGQEMRGVESTLAADWRAEAEKRGYVVISPAAPGGELFFERGDRIFPAFLDMIRKDFKVAGGKLHLAGHSNGGLSAFHVAAKYPAYFSTVTGYPGLLDDGSSTAALKPLCLYMHAGDLDPSWRDAMAAQAKGMQGQGYRIKFTVEPRQQHRLKAAEIDLSRRLFDEIESCK